MTQLIWKLVCPWIRTGFWALLSCMTIKRDQSSLYFPLWNMYKPTDHKQQFLPSVSVQGISPPPWPSPDPSSQMVPPEQQCRGYSPAFSAFSLWIAFQDLSEKLSDFGSSKTLCRCLFKRNRRRPPRFCLWESSCLGPPQCAWEFSPLRKGAAEDDSRFGLGWVDP